MSDSAQEPPSAGTGHDDMTAAEQQAWHEAQKASGRPYTPPALPPFPVDDFTLDQLDHALGAALNGDGEVVGADFTLSRLLDFLSGYDETQLVPLVDEPCREPDTFEYPHPLYTRDCVIRALIAEVRRLRAPSGPSEDA